MNTKRITQDRFLRAMIAGLAGAVADGIIHHLAFLIFKTSTTAMYIGQLLFPFEKISGLRYFHGFFIHLAAGAFVGVILMELYRKYGNQYPYVKAITLGLAFWVVHVAIIPNIINLPNRPYLHRTELEALVDLIAHIFYGVCTAAVFNKYREVEG